MSNPQDEYGLLLDYFELERSELEWTFNKEKGFHCLSYPVNYCLGKNKGVAGSRKASVDKFELYPDLIHVKNAYKDSVFQLFKYIYKCDDQDSCCKLELESNRFQWCKQYFCAD